MPSVTESSIRTAKRLISELRGKVFGKTQKKLTKTEEKAEKGESAVKAAQRKRRNMLRKKFLIGHKR